MNTTHHDLSSLRWYVQSGDTSTPIKRGWRVLAVSLEDAQEHYSYEAHQEIFYGGHPPYDEWLQELKPCLDAITLADPLNSLLYLLELVLEDSACCVHEYVSEFYVTDRAHDAMRGLR